jgi:hypothetical protein
MTEPEHVPVRRIDTEALARDLVKRGLRSAQILEAVRFRRPETADD